MLNFYTIFFVKFHIGQMFLSQYPESTYNWDYDKPPKEPKTFKGVMTRFGSYTSLQGIPFILRAKRWYSRLLWILLFIAALGLTTWQFIEVLQKFLAQDTSTSIKLGYANLEFPSVTICNINPIRQSALNETSPKVMRFIKSLAPPEEYNQGKRLLVPAGQESGQGGQQQAGQGEQQQSGQGERQSGQGGQRQSGQGRQMKRRKRETDDADDVVVTDKHRPVSKKVRIINQCYDLEVLHCFG